MNGTIAFIGAGNMGGTIARACCKAIDPKEVVIYDPSAQQTAAMQAETGCTVAASGAEAVSACHYVFLAVKPQILEPVFRELLPALKACAERGQRQTLVSIVAGKEISVLEALLAEAGLAMPIVRIMPNTPAMVGQGLLLMCRSAAVEDADYDRLCEILVPCGMLEDAPESYLTTAMPVFSCSPAYVYMFIEAMADGAVQLGIPRAKAQRYAAQAVLGSAAMVLETGKHPGELKDAVCSPGGYTIQGVTELERRGFRAAAAQAILVAGGQG